jgi:hypothetical protein
MKESHEQKRTRQLKEKFKIQELEFDKDLESDPRIRSLKEVINGIQKQRRKGLQKCFASTNFRGNEMDIFYTVKFSKNRF